ncbi:MAG: hypothetical protein MJ209_00705 [archaeon]|nr:hypothetical protein [archaeon]
MNKKVLAVIIIIIIAAGAFVFINHNSSKGEAIQMINYVQNGVTFSYPSDWGVSQSNSNYTVAAISLISSIDANRTAQVNIHVEKQNFTGEFNDFVNQTITSLGNDEKYNITSYGYTHVKGKNATQVTFNSYINGTNKMHESVWFEYGSDAYVITYSAPPSTFDKYERIFQYVVSTFQITR